MDLNTGAGDVECESASVLLRLGLGSWFELLGTLYRFSMAD